jgi:hypothetical protein
MQREVMLHKMATVDIQQRLDVERDRQELNDLHLNEWKNQVRVLG